MSKKRIIAPDELTKGRGENTKMDTKKRTSTASKKSKNALKRNRITVHAYDAGAFNIKLCATDVVAKQILGTRKTQQDAFAISECTCTSASEFNRAWAVVCDGMGGMTGGELASQTTVGVFQQIMQNALPEDDIAQVYMQAAAIANAEVKKLSEQLDGTAGTTLVSVVVQNGMLYYVSVGDSRIYISRANEIVQVTRDHNYYLELCEKVAAGELTMQEADNDPQKEALISFIGIEELKLVDVNAKPVALQSDDIVLLCSDGLTKVLHDDEIQEIIQQCARRPEKIVDSLLQEVQMGMSRSLDNTTIAVVKFTENN